MLGLSWTEMLVIGVIALIVIGPKDLPVVMGRVGKFMGQIRRLGSDFQREINRTTGLDEVRNLRNSITSPLKKTADEIRREFNTMTPTGQKPSGVIKPADPKVESVVDELRTAAGMPVEKKSNDALAADYGFKPGEASAGPVKAAQVSEPAAATPAPTAPVATTDLAPIELKPARKPRAPKNAAAKPAVTGAAPASASTAQPDAPTSETVKTEVEPVAAPAPKVRKPRTKSAVTVAEAEPIAPAKKVRAPRKKPTPPAETK